MYPKFRSKRIPGRSAVIQIGKQPAKDAARTKELVRAERAAESRRESESRVRPVGGYTVVGIPEPGSIILDNILNDMLAGYCVTVS